MRRISSADVDSTASARHVSDQVDTKAASAEVELTRDELANRLGVHKSKVRRLEKAKVLHPVLRNGRYVFDLKEVVAYERSQRKGPPSDAGQIAGRAFHLLREGKGFRDLVIELSIEPERARELCRSYALDGDLIVPAEGKREIERFGFGGEGYSLRGEDLPRFFRNLVELIKKLRDRATDLESRLRAAEALGKSGIPPT